MHPLCALGRVKMPVRTDVIKPELAQRLTLPDPVTPAKVGAQLPMHGLLNAEAGC